jgi:cyclase
MPEFCLLKPNLILARSGTALLNATIYKTKDILFVIDSMLTATDSRQLLDKALSLSKGIILVINTHWHSDHCFGNRYFKLYDAKVIAHEKHYQTLFDERSMLSKGKSLMLDKQLVPEPDYVFSKKCNITSAEINCDEQNLSVEEPWVTVTHAPGHSYDNSYVYLPEHNALLAGDNILNGEPGKYALPYFFWGDDELIIKALKNILKRKPDLIIPGHGDPVSLSKVQTDLLYLENLQNRTRELIMQGCYNHLDDLKLMLNQHIRIADCLPDTTADQVWVPNVHTLNINLLAVKYYTQSL